MRSRYCLRSPWMHTILTIHDFYHQLLKLRVSPCVNMGETHKSPPEKNILIFDKSDES